LFCIFGWVWVFFVVFWVGEGGGFFVLNGGKMVRKEQEIAVVSRGAGLPLNFQGGTTGEKWRRYVRIGKKKTNSKR